jgi:hypothetical protein
MLEPWLAALQALPPVDALRASRWTYAAVNAAHITGIALLFGAIVPLDLRLIGAWRGVSIRTLSRVLVPVAAGGLVLAIFAGALLFSIRATEYAALTLFWIKMALVACGVANALLLHRALALEQGTHDSGVTPPARLRAAGALSIVLWLAAIMSGRMLAFVE